MPDVVNYDVQPAICAVRHGGLLGPVKQEPAINDSNPQTVAATVPPGGKMVLADSPVILYVSEGPHICVDCAGGKGAIRKMPPVCGLTFQQANTLLVVRYSITLNPRPIYQASAKPRGTIIGSVPPAGTHFIAYGSRNLKKVVVIISSGGGTPTAGGQGGC